MPPEFKIGPKLARLNDTVRGLRFLGDYRFARPLLRRSLADRSQRDYNPTTNPLLLKLHCAAFSVFDHLGEFEEAQQYIAKWGGETQPLVADFLERIDDATRKGVPLSELPPEDEDLWHSRGWLLQCCGVSAYRKGKLVGCP